MYVPALLKETKSSSVAIWRQGVVLNPLELIVNYKLVGNKSQEW